MNNENKSGFITFVVIVIIFIIYIASNVLKEVKFNNNGDNNKSLRIISSSENKSLNDKIIELAQNNNIYLSIDYADTMDIMTRINNGEKYDGVWTSNSIWLNLIDSSVATVSNPKSLSINPIVLGIKKNKATELGFVNKEITVNDIIDKIDSKELKFAMSNPVSTNSGASAYLGILSSLAGNPEVLTSDILNSSELKSKVREFFTGLSRTSGSEDFLEELFLNGDYEAVFTYETSIININQTLIEENKEPLYAVYPVDGVAISDSTLAYIDNKDSSIKKTFLKLQNLLLGSEGQKILEQDGRRTWYGGVTDNAPQNIFNPEWGIDTTKYITPVKYPSIAVINEAFGLYQVELRKPVHVVFCLDYSGSMFGQGFDSLVDAMDYILGSRATKDYIQFTSGDKIDIIPFESKATEVWSITYSDENGAELLEKIKSKSPYGLTSLYPATINALNLIKDEDQDKYNTSVILMTDGVGNVGSFSSVKEYYQSINRNIPVYSITFGSADESQLDEIAQLTNAKVFDGKTNLVEAFKSVRGYN